MLELQDEIATLEQDLDDIQAEDIAAGTTRGLESRGVDVRASTGKTYANNKDAQTRAKARRDILETLQRKLVLYG